jgi:hypothetical protein
MRESRSSGSVRGVRSNPHPYRDHILIDPEERKEKNRMGHRMGHPALRTEPDRREYLRSCAATAGAVKQ